MQRAGWPAATVCSRYTRGLRPERVSRAGVGPREKVKNGNDSDHGGHGEEAPRSDRRGNDGLQGGARGGERRFRRGDDDSSQEGARERGEESGTFDERGIDWQPSVRGSLDGKDRKSTRLNS